MKALLTVALFSLVPIIGCGEPAGASGTHEGVAREVTGSLEEMIEVLDGVTDGDSVESAKVKLGEIVDRFQLLATRMQEFDPAALEEIKMQVGGALQDLSFKMVGIAAKAFSDPRLLELREVVQDALESLPIGGR